MKMEHVSEGYKSQAQKIILENGYTINDERALLDMNFVHHSIASSYWAIDRPRALTERSWANSMCFGVYDPAGKQVGCARVLTDYTLRAHIADVYINPDIRGGGLGKRLCEFILRHPALKTVTHWTLTSLDAQDLYAKYGFQRGKADDTWMTLTRESG